LFDRNELEEGAAIDDEPHPLSHAAIRDSDEPVARRIHLTQVDTASGEQILVLGAVGREVHAAVGDELQIRVALGKAAAFLLDEVLQEEEQPARRPADRADVFLQRERAEDLELPVPIGDLADLPPRKIERACPARYLPCGDPADVAGIDPGAELVERDAAAEHEALAAENPALRARPQV